MSSNTIRFIGHQTGPNVGKVYLESKGMSEAVELETEISFKDAMLIDKFIEKEVERAKRQLRMELSDKFDEIIREY